MDYSQARQVDHEFSFKQIVVTLRIVIQLNNVMNSFNCFNLCYITLHLFDGTSFILIYTFTFLK